MPGVTPISQKQYFIPLKAQIRIQKHFDRLEIWDPLTLSVILEHPLTTRPETRD
jgi:hypothetical protein